MLAKGNYDLAEQAVGTAIQVVQSNALYLPNRGQDLIARAEALRTKIRQAKVDTDLKIRAERERENVIKDIREREGLNRNARKLLNTIKPTLNLPGIPPNQAIEFIRDIWGAKIVVNYEALVERMQ